MKQENDQLVVRQQERVLCALAVEMRVAPDDAARVVLATTAGAGGGLVRATAVDCSLGGMGIDSPVFFPKGCHITVRAPLADPSGDPSIEPRAVELIAQVKRVSMINRTPSYYLGVLFIGKGEEAEAGKARLMAFVRRVAVPARGAPTGA
jgi:hypothetical protein